MNVGQYLLKRLKEIGVDHIFGVPGDFVLGFFNEILKSDVKYIGTCNELNAAYASDGYARIKGVGAVSTTYAVGELSAINGIAGAYAERVPVVVITGSPATVHYQKASLLHHTLGDYQKPLEMYKSVTAAQAFLENAETAPFEIDRVLTVCLKEKRPVYISLPADVVSQPCNDLNPFSFPKDFTSEQEALKEAIDEAAELLEKAQKPIIVADGVLIRYGLQDELSKILKQTGYPYATMMLGKTVLDEDHPQFIGLYQGDRSRDYVRERTESADGVLGLGLVMSDFNTGGFTTQLNHEKLISAHIDYVRIKNHYYPNVYMKDFIEGLGSKLSKRDPAKLEIKKASEGCVHKRSETYTPNPTQKLTIERFFDRASHFIEDNSVVIAETGVSLFSAAETFMPKGTTFIGQTFYGSIGYTVGATLGAAMADQKRPVALFVGDGSFQVTCQDLSTMIRYGLKPTVFLLNNDGYTIERVIVDHEYNDIQPWKYHQLVEVFGGKKSFDVHTEGDLEKALEETKKFDALTFIEVHTDRFDCSESLRKAGESMAKTNKLK